MNSTETPPASVTQVKAVAGDQLRIDGSDAMVLINRWLKQQFEQSYPQIEVTLDSRGTETALDEVIAGDIDLAAIGRPLMEAETAKGLRQIPVSQDSIAVIVGRSNPFMGSLTVEQFAQILRGEITDWAELGRQPGNILVIDRPQGSDTRQALLNNPRFQDLEGQPASQEHHVTVADTAAVIRRLGGDGIGYAIASQIQHQPQVRVVKIAVLLDTLPGDAIYPYTSLRGYAYRADNPAIQAFLDLVQDPSGQLAINQAKDAEADAITAALEPRPWQRSSSSSPGVGTATTPVDRLLPFWWVLLGGLLLWLGWWLSQRQRANRLRLRSLPIAKRRQNRRRQNRRRQRQLPPPPIQPCQRPPLMGLPAPEEAGTSLGKQKQGQQ
ncbi:putative ABC transporter protein [Halomicronema hongdechloris C2206]|uniref:ABC transporter protein n=1 Tax=Halomicronema hongdechloris C2206 TaxID=1641165 RepID=A0A1Z3HPZ2_9CYAN|nr:substrate-binding domain-containing protein [Halomicronema hongdechloris]ASC72384.1 putative ABC transporter protein [Halomicronema hongdechloris C2206]